MTYLIDSHVLIWYVTGNERLGSKVINAIEDINNDVWLSKASLWEITIKVASEKLILGISLNDLKNFLAEKNIYELDFNYDDLETLLKLPYHHRDPFDRLIISQAITRNLTIITDDNKFSSYPVQLL